MRLSLFQTPYGITSLARHLAWNTVDHLPVSRRYQPDRHPWTWSYRLDMEQLLSGSLNDQVIAFRVDRNDVLRVNPYQKIRIERTGTTPV